MMNMNLQLTRMYAMLIGGLAVIGIFVHGHLLEIMNTDIALDVIRIALAVYLLNVGFVQKSAEAANMALSLVGVLYVGMGVLGLITPTLGGLLPAGLTGFDIVFHIATGALALGAAINGYRHTSAARQ